MAVTILVKDRNVINGVVIDATVSESHRYNTSITKYPVESGFKVTDHCQKENPTLTIEGIVSNAPLYEQTTTGTSKVYNAYNELIKLMGHSNDNLSDDTSTDNSRKPVLFTMVTGLRVWKNCIVSDITINQNEETGNDAFSFNAQLERINIVNLEEYRIPEYYSEDQNASMQGSVAPPVNTNGNKVPSESYLHAGVIGETTTTVGKPSQYTPRIYFNNPLGN